MELCDHDDVEFDLVILWCCGWFLTPLKERILL